MKVLLVEDEQSMLFTLSNLLKHRGYEVIAADSAEKGLEELGDNQVDLVISDLRLPGMDGISKRALRGCGSHYHLGLRYLGKCHRCAQTERL